MRILKAPFVGGLIVLAISALLGGCKKEAPPTTRPATQPASTPVVRAPTTHYVEIVRASYPSYPATQPLGVPVDLGDAGHFILPEPIYLGARGDLWITRDDAPPLEQTIKTATDDQIHIVPDPAEFVQWTTNPETGKWMARVVLREGQPATQPASGPTVSKAQGAATYVWIDRYQKYPTTPRRKYRWHDAVYLNEQVVVPTDSGVSVFTFSPQYKEEFHPIVSQPGHSLPRIVLDGRGFVALSPWEKMVYGSNGAVRYVDGTWTDLNPQADQSGQKWPEKLLHVVPLLDESALQFYRDQVGGPVKLAMGVLDAPHVDEKHIEELVNQLSDEDPDKRSSAYNELQRYGTGSWPVLTKLADDQPPEAQVRIRQLLSNQTQPTLGGRTPLGGVMELADRFADGGVLLFLPDGVSIPPPLPDQPADIVKPAWISIRPGRAIELLEPVLVRDAQPGKQHFFAYGNEWVVSDPVQGPRRLAGNHLESLLNKNESAYDALVGFDSRGRWLFRKSPDDGTTLIVDPTLPDLTPRLPVWRMWVQKGSVGWSRQGYPVIKRGGAWALYEQGWHPLPRGDVMITSMPPRPRHVEAATTQSTVTVATTTSSTQPTTHPATEVARPLGEPILIDSDGTKYYDGRQSLRVIDKLGKEINWVLPAEAVGSHPPTLIRTADGKLFLFNEPGRVVRISPTPSATEPFKVDAVFTHNIPQSDDIQRIWLDPAGRIVMAYQHDRLAIMFPQGRIPPAMRLLIPASELEEGK